ncbi:hypothetical protein [Bradyrhizobium tropiciagri]|uniref:hypothetical protein n=1 Tax=Bradyrhizobium tropiciagri TaxID=312253 RepID=UPI000ADCC2FB|nr:hypothetical protein [Bradyrhizobium tropiciagri]
MIAGPRLEVPNRYRHPCDAEERFASWDLTTVHLVDEHTGTVPCWFYPHEKTRNASGLRRPLDQATAEPVIATPTAARLPCSPD